MFRRERKSNTPLPWGWSRGDESTVSPVVVGSNVNYCKNRMYFMLSGKLNFRIIKHNIKIGGSYV